jgi:hypothetical protein
MQVMSCVVLIVDDNALLVMLCELFERRADFAVCGVAENGRQAIAAKVAVLEVTMIPDIAGGVARATLNGLAAC